MKKKYEKPVIEISLYLVNEAFASCMNIVKLGPSAVYHTACEDYLAYENQGSRPTGLDEDVAVASSGQFYICHDDENCGCYYTPGTSVYLKS